MSRQCAQCSKVWARRLASLETFLHENLDYNAYSDLFADYLAEVLQDNLPEGEADSAQTLARQSARNESQADAKVNEVLRDAGLLMDDILGEARTRKAKELVQEYVRREPDAVTLVEELLSDAGTSMDTLVAKALALAANLDVIERIDRLTAVAEGRRNASLREIDRRRVVLAETLRRTVQEVEDPEFEVIETTPAKGQKRSDLKVTSDNQVMANRANARTSTGPKTMQGRTRSARNALRHALSLPVYSNLVLCEEVDALAREIAGTDAKPKFESSRAESPKRRSICAACVARAIDSCPRHWAILPMPLRQTCGKNWQSSATFCETRLPTHRSGLWRSISPPCRRGRTYWRRSS